MSKAVRYQKPHSYFFICIDKRKKMEYTYCTNSNRTSYYKRYKVFQT